MISPEGPQRLQSTSGGVTAFELRSPDGHPLELISFPPGSGDQVWQQHTNGLALGLGHTAISVGNVDERSIAFYRLLDFELASCRGNRAAEQLRLDALAEVEVDIIALRPAKAETPHLELLGYRTPHGRKCLNMDFCDVAADRMVVQAQNLRT